MKAKKSLKVTFCLNSERESKGLSELDFDAMKFDYDSYHEKVSQDCCCFIESELKDYVSEIIYEKLSSPKEYNFANDAIHVTFVLTQENIDEIKKFIFQNLSDFSEYIKSSYTSYDGFISHYSNEPTEWLLYLDACIRHQHQLGSILEFIARMTIEEPEMSMYSACEAYVSVENYEDCTEREYCTECREFVKPEDFLGSCCKECFEIGVHKYTVIACSCCKEKIINRWEVRQYLYKLNHHIITPYEIVCSDCQLKN